MKKILLVLILIIFPIISFADDRFIHIELWLREKITGSQKSIYINVENIYNELIFKILIRGFRFEHIKI